MKKFYGTPISAPVSRYTSGTSAWLYLRRSSCKERRYYKSSLGLIASEEGGTFYYLQSEKPEFSFSTPPDKHGDIQFYNEPKKRASNPNPGIGGSVLYIEGISSLENANSINNFVLSRENCILLERAWFKLYIAKIRL